MADLSSHPDLPEWLRSIRDKCGFPWSTLCQEVSAKVVTLSRELFRGVRFVVRDPGRTSEDRLLLIHLARSEPFQLPRLAMLTKMRLAKTEFLRFSSHIKPAAPLLACVIRWVFFCPDSAIGVKGARP
jgi:hypothetical protein